MKSIVGIWRLIRTSARNDAGEAMHPPYGEKPRGLVVFYPDKRMMSVLCDGRSELPAAETVREYNSYCGNYDYDGENLITRVDASASKDRVGGEQAPVEQAHLVGGRVRVGLDPPRVNDLLALEGGQHRVGVPDVDAQQHD